MTFANNPLGNPLFIPVAVRLAALLAAGFFLVVAFNLKKLSTMGNSEAWQRYRSWLFMAPTFLLGVFCGGIVAVLFISFLIFQASREYWTMLSLPHFYRRILLINGLLSVGTAIVVPHLVYLLPVAYFLLVILVSILNNQLEEIFNNVCYTLFGSIWICFPLVHFLLFGSLQGGTGLLIQIAFSIALADICAFAVGKLFFSLGIGANAKIADLISPNKTWAGIAGNLLGAIIGTLLFASLNSRVPFNLLLWMGACIGVSTVLGDLAESMIKRFCDVKDSSDCIPGHGGLLDRIDSMLVVIIVCYYFLRLFSPEAL
jgi:phosphatidate cytidylyltransferase